MRVYSIFVFHCSDCIPTFLRIGTTGCQLLLEIVHLFLKTLCNCQSFTLLEALALCRSVFVVDKLRQVRTKPGAETIVYSNLFERGVFFHNRNK